MEKSAKIVVTGSEGFIGKNLLLRLRTDGFENICEFSRKNNLADLDNFTKDCDFVFHLAAVNRSQNEKDFFDTNQDFTIKLLKHLEKNSNNASILFSSSIHAKSNTAYGKSKKKAEDAILNYCKAQKVKHHIYRLPNVFGKWSRPNYNSVVSTFCNNIAHNLPITINDKNATLTLCYIDDVIDSFIESLYNKEKRDGDFCFIDKVEKISIDNLSKKIYAFKRSRDNLEMPNLRTHLDRQLYATFLSFLPPDNFSYFLDKKEDHRGWLAEFIKSKDFGQIFISKSKEDVKRGNHWHNTKVEKFLVIQGDAIIRFKNLLNKEVLEYSVSGDKPEVVDIPPGYVHNITNVGPKELITIFWASEMFNSVNPDTYYEEF